jgi:hypothetical protein
MSSSHTARFSDDEDDEDEDEDEDAQDNKQEDNQEELDASQLHDAPPHT